jgi:tRNA dimethylallyltransferase
MKLEYRVLTGPTAAGKTACLLRRGASRPLAVISSDSRQVYLGMDIGTGKPSESDQKILPHHVLDLIEPPISFSVYQFIIECARIFNQLEGTDAEIWVCGGTGLYIRALVDALPLRLGPRPRLRVALQALLESEPPEVITERLGLELDEPHNPARVIRACEAACSTTDALSQFYGPLGLSKEDCEDDAAAQVPSIEFELALRTIRRWRCLGIAVFDPGGMELNRLIELRVRNMFTVGLLEEAVRLSELGYAGAPVVRDGIAYREALAVLKGELELEQAIEQAVIRTRQYAKRQRTYFRGQGWVAYTTARECLAACQCS